MLISRNGESLCKNVTYDFDRFWYVPLNGMIEKVILWDIDLLFQCKKFEMLIVCKWWELMQKCQIWHWYIFIFELNGSFVKVVLHDLDKHFQGK